VRGDENRLGLWSQDAVALVVNASRIVYTRGQGIPPTGNFRIKLDWAVSTGAHITISLNRATVPNVVGTDAASTESTLQAAGFLYDVHEVVDSTCTRLNKVTGQGMAGQARAIPGSMVTIDVNVAPAPPAERA